MGSHGPGGEARCGNAKFPGGNDRGQRASLHEGELQVGVVVVVAVVPDMWCAPMRVARLWPAAYLVHLLLQRFLRSPKYQVSVEPGRRACAGPGENRSCYPVGGDNGSVCRCRQGKSP